jgi:RNA recognition motif-containing protein
LPDLLDEEDSATTNLYLSNLSSMVTEELLYEIFRKFGEINSIKIMWPRSEDEKHTHKRNCGFVSFKHRSDASDALVSHNSDHALSCSLSLVHSSHRLNSTMPISLTIGSLSDGERLSKFILLLLRSLTLTDSCHQLPLPTKSKPSSHNLNSPNLGEEEALVAAGGIVKIEELRMNQIV